ncbi:MAG: hypothetical protein FK734_14515 [Asgard group archaeon]|nr:hypothetical protein [Asgard group archaeon]
MNAILRKTSILTLSLFIITLTLNSTLISNFSDNLISIQDIEIDNNDQTNMSINNEYISIKSDNFNSDSVWSQPFQITNQNLQRNQYSIAQDDIGNFYAIWLRITNNFGYEIFFSQSVNLSINEWTDPIQILNLGDIIYQLNIIVDKNQVIHVIMQTNREGIQQILYISKGLNETSWHELEILETTTSENLIELKTLISINNTLIVGWINHQIGTSLSTRNSSIHMITKTNSSLDWNNLKIIADNDNPITFALTQTKTDELILTYSNWASDYVNNEIYFMKSTNEGNSWLSKNLIYTYIERIGNLKTHKAIAGGFHLLWTSYTTYKKLNYAEVFMNNTLRESPIIISNILKDSYIAGIAENSSSNNLYVLYEENTGTITNIANLYYRMRNGSSLLWNTAVKFTYNDVSTMPNFISITNSNVSLGKLYYIDNYDLIVRSFNDNGEFSNSTTIMITTKNNSKSCLVVDSDGIKHHIWQHIGKTKVELFYQIKNGSSNWSFQGSITGEWENTVTSPELAIDSDDTLYCTFIARDDISSFEGLYLTKKLKGSNEWEIPILVKQPENNAETNNYAILIDADDTLHIVWNEIVAAYQNKLIYSQKLKLDDFFTSENLQINENGIMSNTPNLVVDSYNTVHLAFVEVNRINDLDRIKYSYKLSGGIWSEKIQVRQVDQDDLIRPKMVVDSNDKISMTFIRKYDYSAYRVSDVELWQKPYNFAWAYASTLVSIEIMNYHNLFITNDDTMIYVYHQSVNPLDGIQDSNYYDKINAAIYDPIFGWGETEIIYYNPYQGYEIVGAYDQVTDNIHLLVNSKIGSNNYIHYITRQNDTDDDQLGDQDELILRTDPGEVDSDNDLLIDGEEIRIYRTNPALNDTDWDGLTDGEEVLTYLTSPITIYSDDDIIPDGDEVLIYHTDPNSIDSDNDLIPDDWEIFVFHTNPNSDDSDMDFMPDYWEIINGLNPIADDSYFDADSDGLYNIEEYWYHTDPNDPDSDDDELSDGDEINLYDTNPLEYDTDEDTIGDSDEVLIFHTNPNNPDSDGDGFSDRQEINAGTDPNNPRDNIRTRKILRIILFVVVPVTSLIIIFGFFEIRYRVKLKRLLEEEKDEISQEKEKLNQLMEYEKQKTKEIE